MTLYLDTSVLVKLYVDEEGSSWARKAVADAQSIITSMLAYAETRSALARQRREGRLSPRVHRRTVEEFERDWEHYIVVETASIVIRLAGSLCERHVLRAYDAVHLASAKTFQEKIEEQIAFASWDGKLETAAKREGLQVIQKV